MDPISAKEHHIVGLCINNKKKVMHDVFNPTIIFAINTSIVVVTSLLKLVIIILVTFKTNHDIPSFFKVLTGITFKTYLS